MQLSFEQQKNYKAIGITIGVHLLLLLFFLLFKYAMPHPVASDVLGMEVNLGTSDNGSGNDQPEIIGQPANYEANLANNAQSQLAKQVNLDNIHTTNNADAPAINLNKDKSKNNKATAQENPDNKPKQVPKHLYPGSTGNGTGNDAEQNVAGGDEGIGTGKGDMGVPGGTPGAKNYSGIPGGKGNISALVGNRKLVSRPSPEAEYREGGKVVFRVTVTRDGIITNSSIVSASNPRIQAIALEKIKQAKFNPSPNSPAEMFGTITFDFVTR